MSFQERIAKLDRAQEKVLELKELASLIQASRLYDVQFTAAQIQSWRAKATSLENEAVQFLNEAVP